MANVVLKMADLSTNSDQVRILKWLVELGSQVESGQNLYEVETDKATMDVESPLSGKLVAVLAAEGDLVSVGQEIAIFQDEKPEQSCSEVADRPVDGENVIEPTSRASCLNASVPSEVPRRPSLFSKNKKMADSKPAGPSTLELTGVQRIVAERMRDSKQTVPHFYLTDFADAEAIVHIRQMAKTQTPPRKIVWDAFFVKAAAKALMMFDKMSYRFVDNRLVRCSMEAIGVAVDVADDLYVIAIKSPASKDIFQISGEIENRIIQIRQGDPSAKKLESACMTISNLGGVGIESFTAIVNPPEASILAIGRIGAIPVVQDGQVVVRHQAKLSLSVDHRVVSGKYAASFLCRIAEEIRMFGEIT